MGKEIIDANERYVEELYEAVRAAKRAGVDRGHVDLPVAEFLAAGTAVDETYRALHRDNIEWVYDEV
jgi:hypothetical protein